MLDDQSNAVTQPADNHYRAQVELEQWGLGVGAERALADGWQAGPNSYLANKMVAIYLEAVRNFYASAGVRPGKMAHVWDLMHNTGDVEQSALEALFYVFGAVGTGTGDRPFNGMALTIGYRAEQAMWLNQPQWKNSYHLEGLRLASGNDLRDPRIFKRLIDRDFLHARGFKPLTKIERCALGATLLQLVVDSTAMFEIETVQTAAKRKHKIVKPSVFYWEFLGRWREGLRMFRPSRMPMIATPLPWTDHRGGGWFTHDCQLSTVPREEWPEISRRLGPSLLRAVNGLQSVAYRFDQDMINLAAQLWERGHALGSLPCRERLEEPNADLYRGKVGNTEYWRAVWRYRSDRRRDATRSRYIISRITADKLQSAERFHFVHTIDHRGRTYVRGGLISPQASDLFRHQLQFAEQSPVKGHEDQFAWSLGEAKGLAPDAGVRVRYLADFGSAVERAGGDPLGNLAFIEGAKEPWRFAQLCRDWHGYRQDPGYRSGTVHWLDQTCSGWGHTACLLGDGTLARFTNVTGDQHIDLYAALGKLVMKRLHWRCDTSSLEDKSWTLAAWWIDNPPSRKLFKEVLMPVIYGRSYITMVETIKGYLRDEIDDFLADQGLRLIELSHALAGAINEVQKEALPNARILSRWLGEVAALQMRAGQRPHWYTPTGLKVETYLMESVSERIKLVISGRHVSVKIGSPVPGKFAVTRTRKKQAPDFIHSFDAAFLHQFVHYWQEVHRRPMATVHDCFGTTLESAATLRRELCDSFGKFYTFDYLTRHQGVVAAELGVEVPAPPLMGTLDRSRIGENPALFT